MASTKNNHKTVLSDILSIDQNNRFLPYIMKRLRSDHYRGWHVSQHNRYGLDEVTIILREIHRVASTNFFAIPPGDYSRDRSLPTGFENYQAIVEGIYSQMARGTINSIKKNFFPDLDKMCFLQRKQLQSDACLSPVSHGRLTQKAADFIKAKSVIERYKIFTDGVDNLFGSKISELAELIYLSDYGEDSISVYEFMFILSDESKSLDKIGMLSAFRKLNKHKRNRVIALVQRYADPTKFGGNKTAKRDFHNWKNQAQQILNLLKTTVYFEVDQNEYFRLNTSNTGFFRATTERKIAPKRKYFSFHQIEKRAYFELHHIVPISSARNKQDAKVIDDHRNLIYIHRKKHKQISAGGSQHVVLDINPSVAVFSDIAHDDRIKAKNKKTALYSDKPGKIKTMVRYNATLLESIFQYSTE